MRLLKIGADKPTSHSSCPPSRPINMSSSKLTLAGGLEVQAVDEAQLNHHHIQRVLDSAENYIGLAPIYGPNVALTSLTLASNTQALVIRFSRVMSSMAGNPRKAQNLLEDKVFCNDSVTKYAFLMDKLIFTLAHWYGVRISSAVSLLPPEPRDSLIPVALEEAVKGTPRVFTKAILSELFKDHEGQQTDQAHTVRQAWLAQYAGGSSTRTATPIWYNSADMDALHLEETSRLYCLALQLRQMKPDVVKNDIDKAFKIGKGGLDLTSARFKTRITRASAGQRLEIRVSQGGREFNVSARTKQVEGRGAKVAPAKIFSSSASIVHVKTYGRERPTNAEEVRHELLVDILKGTVRLLHTNTFVQRIFFPERLGPWPVARRIRNRRVVLSDRTILNGSQGRAVEAIISLEGRRRVVLIHGPPGTGKTTVIAASAHSIVRSDLSATVWLVAHSNVAVKNIAEKLVNSNFLDFKIVVSKEFHFDWHEHLYQKVERNLIRTDSLPDDTLAAHRVLLGSRVILSTISNLLNQKMASITLVAPVQTLIVDEASQIGVGDYLPVIHRFQNTLEKLVFIGDDKQLAPYGYEQIKELESIFEKQHLRRDAILLDTQYRMPVVLGNFISKHVYSGLLDTIHSLTSRKTCRFVNVYGTKEEKEGHSWMNLREAATVISLARLMVDLGLSFRIITPYDPQRSLLENELKREKLPHEDKVFNVDSFQGNEADFIIVSLVRSGTKLGFLQEQRRANVMLTRCKKGMVICTNRTFVEGVARDSLVGKLARSLGPEAWIDSSQLASIGGRLFA
ncbi:P-loop containing nucleoside triphosphate hydrolase protein [Ephemerocybe angulata]|uniref:P-loop containing nucleoside triphosphate hydrolase protein n=1 Tax=Ephemerocybe angulata TaxID=980116 RepID=A0A8H6H7X0_9AGAR|nr:P-loop containing nucleoside triphosphate hydrolase protein [Tulosesus angulatus]